jgi:F-type H+-transporting ATPase subunit a
MEEVFPRVVFTVFGLPIRDTVISTWVTMIIILAAAWAIRRSMPIAVELLIEFLRGQLAGIMGGMNVDPYIPFLGALVIFLLIANNIGVVPLVQTPTKDINTTAAMGITVLLAVHIFAIRAKGPIGYLKGMATPLTILDIISDLSRTLSLSLRLFGNIIAGEIIVAVIYRLVPPVAPLSMVVLGMVTGVLQAYIFAILSTSAIASAVRTDG